MIRLVPPIAPHRDVTYELDGVKITLVWHYTERDGHWRTDIIAEDGSVIRSGMKLSPGWSPYRRVVDARMPPGAFWFSSPNDPPGIDAFTRDEETASLVYFTVDEALALADAGLSLLPQVTTVDS